MARADSKSKPSWSLRRNLNWDGHGTGHLAPEWGMGRVTFF
jgi:hypothetical protein